MSVDLVVSHYRDSLEWTHALRPHLTRTFVYDKRDIAGKHDGAIGVYPSEALTIVSRANVGKCDESYLYHIVTHWDDLADWTVFSVDAPHDRMHEVSMEGAFPSTPDLSFLGIPQEYAKDIPTFASLRVPRLWKGRDWDPVTGRLNWHQWGSIRDRNGTNWKDRYESGIITPAALSFVEWMRKYIGHDPNGPDWPGYAPGGIMGVPRRAITYLPKAFYERLRDQLSHAIEPEEGHYMERSWTAIFVGKARYQPEEATV